MHTEALAANSASFEPAAYIIAHEQAAERASWSNFDIHVVHNADGSFWIIGDDECDFDVNPFLDNLIETVPGRMSGLY